MVATYECNSGLVIRENNKKQCSSEGVWTGHISPCGKTITSLLLYTLMLIFHVLYLLP